MRKLIIILATGVAMSSGASAFARNSPARPSVVEGDWHLVGVSDNDGGSVMFIEGQPIRHVGQAAVFDVLTISRQLQRLEGLSAYDGEKETLLVDCGSRRSLGTALTHYRGNGEGMPIVFTQQSDGNGAPSAGTLPDRALRIACDGAPMEPERIRDPYAWARAHWSLKR
jgi:hypothetical protein